MCSFSSEQSPHVSLVFALRGIWPPKIQHRHLQLNRHNRRRAQLQEARRRKRKVALKKDIKMRNIKLYMENQSIIEENEKLRKQALLLHKENQALLSQLQNKLSQTT